MGGSVRSCRTGARGRVRQTEVEEAWEDKGTAVCTAVRSAGENGLESKSAAEARSQRVSVGGVGRCHGQGGLKMRGPGAAAAAAQARRWSCSVVPHCSHPCMRVHRLCLSVIVRGVCCSIPLAEWRHRCAAGGSDKADFETNRETYTDRAGTTEGKQTDIQHNDNCDNMRKRRIDRNKTVIQKKTSQRIATGLR